MVNSGLLIVGNTGGTNVGGSFLRAAMKLGLEVQLVEMSLAMRAPAFVRRFNWWVRGRRPTRLNQFSNQLVKTISETRPQYLLATGTAPITREAMEAIGRLGVVRINYLTDDPWNPAHRAVWFLEALPRYDRVFTPRLANYNDLKEIGCPEVDYLPFAYDEDLFFAKDESIDDGFESDVMFAGGADRGRVSHLSPLIAAGFKVALYGDCWERYRETKSYSKGHADPATLRKAIKGTKVALCLVRKANRDGHVMRTFEVPAVGACMLVEDTEEHRQIFGGDNEAVVYFQSIEQMIYETRCLLTNDSERRRLACSAHKLILGNGNAYKHRLVSMLVAVNGEINQ